MEMSKNMSIYFLNKSFSLFFTVHDPHIFNNNKLFYSKIFEEVMIILNLSQKKDEKKLIKIKKKHYYILFILDVLLKNSSNHDYISKPIIKNCFVSINNIFYNILIEKDVEPQETELLFEAMSEYKEDNLSSAVLEKDYPVYNF